MKLRKRSLFQYDKLVLLSRLTILYKYLPFLFNYFNFFYCSLISFSPFFWYKPWRAIEDICSDGNLHLRNCLASKINSKWHSQFLYVDYILVSKKMFYHVLEEIKKLHADPQKSKFPGSLHRHLYDSPSIGSIFSISSSSLSVNSIPRFPRTFFRLLDSIFSPLKK